jgi:glycine/D-amino acid oxidase-like deaminating enzyme/nitrite reductase/ring-hydroxylating ferredoxin subunit
MTAKTARPSIDPTSLWTDSVSRTRFPRLPDDCEVDVVVIGAGITGITAAYLLKEAGRKVALLERDRWGGVDTSHTTAHITAVTDRRLHELAAQWDEARTRSVWDAGVAAIDQIVANIANEAIQCDFQWVPGYLHAAPDADLGAERKRLEEDVDVAAKLGIRATLLPRIPHFEMPGVLFPGQATFHPLKYLGPLIRTIPGRGSYVFEHSPVTAIESDPLGVRVGDHFVSCRYLVLATHTPLTGNTGTMSALLFQTKLAAYTTYAVGARLRRNTLPIAAFWDTANPYRYLRVDRRRGYDYAILGGEDHKTGQEDHPEDRYRRLEERLNAIAPGAEVDHRWSGQVIETPDGLPYIGETAQAQFIATGFGGNGITFGTLGAVMAVDAVLARRNPWQELFSPDRKKVRGSLLAYLDENKDYPYYLVRDRLARGRPASVRAVRREEGKIIEHDGQRVAAYRDADGKVTLRSAACTHLGCIVHWNDVEKTWDCPCHGSRFTATGDVMSGPAEEPLAEIAAPAEAVR